MAKKSGGDQELLKLLMGAGAEKQLLSPAEMVRHLQEQGYRIVKDDPERERRHTLQVKEFSKARWAGGHVVKFGAISCTHLGSRNQQLTFLESFYDRMVDEGISTVLHSGDVSDGDGRVYRGHEFDLFAHGFDRQADYVIEKYPRREGVKTYAISGNHDWSFYQRGGSDILLKVAGKRSDFEYLGPMAAQITLGGVKVQLTHGTGGGAYARSYKQQKRIEQFAPEQKPEVYLLGHYHSWSHLPMYRNVVGWQMGCFQSQTEFLKRLGLYPELGGLILTIYCGTDGADRPNGFVRVVDEIVPFYVPKENDF
jgi:predicted phosphodiesterase